MITLITLVSIMLYLMAVGFLQPKISNWLYHGSPDFRYKSDANIAAFIMAALMPIFLPIMCGSVLSNKDWTHIPRAEKRRQKELAEATHKVELAKIKAQEIAASEKAAGLLG